MTHDISALIKNAGHSALKPIQEETIHAFKREKHLVVYSKTGSGKTLAFLLSYLSERTTGQPSAVILSPSRELCLQIEKVFRSLKTGLKVTVCYGGHSMKTEINSLHEDPDLIIATPGRLTDHLERKTIDLSSCPMLVIDEFDKCLEFGFNEEMRYIVHQLKQHQRTLLTSATKIDDFPTYLKGDSFFVIDHLEQDASIKIKEFGVRIIGDELATLQLLINSFGSEKSIIFCNYREVTEDVAAELNAAGLVTVAYHGGMEQDERERALIKFRNNSTNVLICTDLGARGLDIDGVEHIVHYQYPGSEDAFTHRQGRTARMNASGNSYLFLDENKQLPFYLSEPKHYWNPKERAADPTLPQWTTLYFSGGKKDKVNKIDIVGFLAKKGMLEKNEIGKIEVLDRASYVAIPREAAKKLLQRIQGEKVKGKRLKIAISK